MDDSSEGDTPADLGVIVGEDESLTAATIWPTICRPQKRRPKKRAETVDTAAAADEVPVGVAIESDNDRIFGGTGNDWIFGQSGDDVLFGGELDNVLTTEFLTDLLLSGSGAA